MPDAGCANANPYRDGLMTLTDEAGNPFTSKSDAFTPTTVSSNLPVWASSATSSPTGGSVAATMGAILSTGGPKTSISAKARYCENVVSTRQYRALTVPGTSRGTPDRLPPRMMISRKCPRFATKPERPAHWSGSPSQSWL